MPIKYGPLGGSPLQVSNICLGTMTFGEAAAGQFMHGVGAPEKTAFEIMDRAYEKGVNFWDTANVYGEEGLSERIIGKWFEKNKSKRAKIILATKFRFTMGSGPDDKGASRSAILKAIDGSLKRLQTDCIDLYQIHMQDMKVPEEETLETLNELIQAGKVKEIGCSNYAGYRLMHSLAIAKNKKLNPFISLQAQYSLTCRTTELELTPILRDNPIDMIAWSPLMGGFLSGKYKKEDKKPKQSRLSSWGSKFLPWDQEKNWQILDALKEVAAQQNKSCAEIALAWCLTRPFMRSVIIGARTVAQFEENIKAAEVTLSDDQIKKLNKVSELDLFYPYEFIKNVNGKW